MALASESAGSGKQRKQKVGGGLLTWDVIACVGTPTADWDFSASVTTLANS